MTTEISGCFYAVVKKAFIEKRRQSIFDYPSNNTRRTKNLNMNLSSYLPDRPLARAVVNNNVLQRPGGSPSDDLIIQIMRVNRLESDPTVRFKFNGACCSSLSVTDGGSC